jgi:putative aldouronate transport system permease protein
MYSKSVPQHVFRVFNSLFLVCLAVACILPLWNVAAVSFSGKAAAESGMVGLWPIKFNLNAYEKTFSNDIFITAFWISFKRVALGTFLSMSVMVAAAYALSKDYTYFKGRTAIMWFFVITMLFNGGLVPAYILIYKLHLMNHMGALVLPNAVNVFNLILLLNFFRAVPRELEESALIDGAGQFTTLLRIYIPISMPSIATIMLFTIVFHWNSWFDGLLYMTDTKNYPLGTLLQTLIQTKDLSKIIVDSTTLKTFSPRTLTGAQICIGTLPVLLIYPFLQKYFVKGIVLGSVKG